MTLHDAEEKLSELLKAKHLTISSAESCTGGMIAHTLTLRSGSSEYFKGAVVSYCNEVKMNVLGVNKATIDRYTVVSREVAEEMATGVKSLMATDVSVSTTGIAGPSGAMDGKPVGTVCICAASKERCVSRCILFSGDRASVIAQASEMAMLMACEVIETA